MHPPDSEPGLTPAAPVELAIDARRFTIGVLIVCVFSELLLVILDYQVNFSRMTEIGALRRLFNITREDGLASWFGVTQTLLIALTLWGMAAVTRRLHPVRKAAGWVVLALFFTYTAVDDGAQVHERIGTSFRVLQERAEAEGQETWGTFLINFYPSYSWHIVVLPLFGILGLFALVFLWREMRQRYLRVLVLAAIACLVFAVGLDFIEGLEPEHRWNLYTRISERFPLDDFTTRRFGESPYETLLHFSKSLEEALEMLANTLLWFALLRHAAQIAGDVRIRFLYRRP